MTEYEAWNYIANPKNWRITHGLDFYRFYSGEVYFGKGLCRIVDELWYSDQITYRTSEEMSRKIKQHNKGMYNSFYWSIWTKYGNTQRRKFCREQAKLLKDA